MVKNGNNLNLKDEIYMLKQQLERLLSSEQINSDLTLELSRRLDNVIAQYYKNIGKCRH